jgi:hypothetical protein
MKIGAMTAAMAAGALALTGAFTIPSGAQAAVLTIELNDYDRA